MANRVKSGTLVANVATQVVFSPWYGSIEIVNRGAVPMWVRLDKVNPTIAGDESSFVPVQGIITLNNPQPAPNPATNFVSNCDIRMIASETCDYTVSVGI